MCIAEVLEAVSRARPVSRRGVFGLTAGSGLAAAALSQVARAPAVADAATPAAQSGSPGIMGVSFRWSGTNSWEIGFGNRTILVDPWLTRFDSGAFSGRFNLNTPLSIDEPLLDQHVQRADQILIGHGHFDHIADIPYIAKKTGAMVIGSETHMNLLRAYGVAEAQLVTVKGGENMQFDGYSIEVFPGLHGLSASKQFIVPTHLISVPATPKTVGDLAEGDTLIYQITVSGGPSIFAMSTSNYIERWLTGLRPDIAIIAATGGFNQVHRYTERLLGVLNYPKVILPTHWDNWELPLSDPVVPSAGLNAFSQEARLVAPQSQVMMLDYLQEYAP